MPALKKGSAFIFVLFTLISIHAYSADKPPYYDQCFKFFLSNSNYSAAQISSYCNKNASYSFYEATEDWRTKLPVWLGINLSWSNSGVIYVDVMPSTLPVAMSDKFETSMNDVLFNLQSLPDFRTVNILTMAAQHDVILKKMKMDRDQLSFESMLTIVEAIRTQIEKSDLSTLDTDEPEFESKKLQLYTCAANLYNFKIGSLTKESEIGGGSETLDSLREIKQSKHFGRYFSPADAFTACGAAGPTLIQCGMDTYNDQDEPKRFSFKSVLEICEKNSRFQVTLRNT